MKRTTQPVWSGDDFPSWLSPMVVKELRQGVQSGAFAWTFITIQVAMFLFFSNSVLVFDAIDRRTGLSVLEFVFWPVVGLAVLVILPLRGLGAISGERTGNNLDLVRLTQLSSTKIVLGKWLAIVAQGALIVTAVLPYVVLRYFFGDVNVIRDLAAIGWLFVGAMAVAAAAIALSTKPFPLRIAAVVLVLPFFFSFIELFDNPGGPGRSAMRGSSWLGLLAAVGLYTMALLEYSASAIAPVAENHSLRKRSVAIVIGMVWLLTAAVTAPETAASTALITLPLLLAYGIEAILERPVHLKSQVAAFSRWGLPGRLAARLLMPGWPTGMVFVLVLSALCLTACWWSTSGAGFDLSELTAVLAIGTLLTVAVVFPLPVVVWFPRLRNRFLVYLLIQLACLLAFVYANAIRPPGTSWENWPQGWMPLLPLPIASICSLTAGNGSFEMAIFCLAASGMVCGIVMLTVMRPWLREMRQTSQLLAEQRASPHRQSAADGGGAMA